MGPLRAIEPGSKNCLVLEKAIREDLDGFLDVVLEILPKILGENRSRFIRAVRLVCMRESQPFYAEKLTLVGWLFPSRCD